MIYLDSAAVVKLVPAEPESPALRAWLAERAETEWVSSILAEIETFRALASSQLTAARTAVTAALRACVTVRLHSGVPVTPKSDVDSTVSENLGPGTGPRNR